MTRGGGLRDRPTSDRTVNLLTIALPVILAAALSAYELSARSLWLDEGATIAIASQHGATLWRAIGHDGGNMLAYYLLIHLVIAVFGAGQVAVRVPSVIATAATAGIVVALGLRLFDRRVALGAGVLVAVSLPLVFWGQDARGYALMVTLAAASFLAFAMVLEGSRGAIWAYGLSTLLAVYVSFDAILIVPAQLLVLVLPAGRPFARRVLWCLGVVALAYIPLLLLALNRGSSQLFWVPSPSLSVLDQAAVTVTSAGMPPNFHATATTTATLLLTAALLLATLGVAGWRARRSATWPVLLVVSWLAVPVVLGLAAAFAGEPIELARAGMLLVPAFALLLAWAGARLPRGSGWALVGGLIALRALQLAPAYGVSPENWRAAASYVLAASDRGACVAFYPEDGRMPFDYYVRGRSEVGRLRPVLPALAFSQVRPFVERYVVPAPARLDAIAAQCPRLWLISSHQGQRHGPAVSRRDFRRYQRLLSALARRYARQRVRKFGYAAVVRTDLFSARR